MDESVFVVDDDPGFRRVAHLILDAVGLAVSGEADSAAAAVVAISALKPSAVLVDVGLPDRDGLSLSRELVALPWRPRVLLTSTNPEAATSDEVAASGAAGFVAKDELPNAPLYDLFTRSSR
jgi:DNA-binding NarL/FixJ family response regulator